MIILTGPNMAGKSTILRQIGLIVLMAQIGSFVPATQRAIGVVDRVFTRVGASDNLVRGQSTFMVEMSETSAILHTATRRSLVLLDEIGRGTSTYDGVSIAWAVSEHLHDAIGCKTVFATHYHELTQLAEERAARAELQRRACARWATRCSFFTRSIAGGADRSYGIEVGRLAGLPPAVVSRARAMLALLEAEHHVVQPGAASRDAAPAPLSSSRCSRASRIRWWKSCAAWISTISRRSRRCSCSPSSSATLTIEPPAQSIANSRANATDEREGLRLAARFHRVGNALEALRDRQDLLLRLSCPLRRGPRSPRSPSA